MFWTNNYSLPQHLESLLNREDVTLQELMDEEDILQECKSQNTKLIEYLTRSEVMEELVTLITTEPSAEIEEHLRYKYPSIACELLTCDVPPLNEKLGGDEALLAKLYSFIDTDQPLNPLLASFFSKTLGVLVARQTEQVLEFLKSQQHCVDLLLRHLETSAIMDLVLKLVEKVEGSDMRQNMLNWLDSQQLVQRLVKLLAPTSESAKHTNAAQLLCNITTIGKRNKHFLEKVEPDPILETIESGETVHLLLETILTGEKLESSIVGGIQVLLTLLAKKFTNVPNEDDVYWNNAGFNEVDATDNEHRMKIAEATLPFLEQLHNILLDPPHKPAVKTTAGLLDVPLGNARLHVANLIAALLSTENIKVQEKLAELGTFQILLDLFFKYSWNNFLHTQVQQCLALVINCNYEDGNDSIYNHIFIKCKLIDRILEAWDKNESKQSKENGKRQGYMGHLINIANDIVKQSQKLYHLDNFLKTNLPSETLSKWESLVNTQLAKVNKTRQISLSGQAQVQPPNSDGNPEEYGSYSEETYVQQMYSNYQEQQMTPQFIEKYGYHDDQFNDGDDALHNSVDQLTTLAFTLSEEDLDKREDMFNKMCQQKQKAGMEDSSGGVEWGDEGEVTFQTVVDKRDWPSKQQQQHDSSSSDEEEEDARDMQDTHMEIDSTDPWDSERLQSNPVIPEAGNPWETAPSEPVESTGWANFDNFESAPNIESSVMVNSKSGEELMKKEAMDASRDSKENEKLSKEKTTLENSGGAGDGNVIAPVECNASLGPTEANLNSKTKNENVYPVPASDKNANPRESLDTRKPACTKDENSILTECTKNPREKLEVSSERETTSCIPQNAPAPEVMLTAKDSK